MRPWLEHGPRRLLRRIRRRWLQGVLFELQGFYRYCADYAPVYFGWNWGGYDWNYWRFNRGNFHRGFHGNWQGRNWQGHGNWHGGMAGRPRGSPGLLARRTAELEQAIVPGKHTVTTWRTRTLMKLVATFLAVTLLAGCEAYDRA